MKRYDFDCDVSDGDVIRKESPTGEYVRWEEVKALLDGASGAIADAVRAIEDHNHHNDTPCGWDFSEGTDVEFGDRGHGATWGKLKAALQALEHAKGE